MEKHSNSLLLQIHIFAFATNTENGVMQDIDDESKNWITRVKECIHNGHYPVDPSINQTKLPTNRGLLFWIGAVRSFSLSDDIDYSDGYLQGYIDRNWNLNFPTDAYAPRLRALCMGSISSSSSSSTRSTETTTQPSSMITTTSSPSTMQPTPTPSTSNITTTSSPSTVQSTTTPSTSSNTPSKTTPSGQSKSAHSDDSNRGLVALYIVVPLVSLVIVIAIGYFIWRRRRKLPDKQSRPPGHRSIQPQNGTSPSKGTKLSLDDSSFKHTDATVSHDYLILEPVNEYAAIQDTHLDQDDEEDYDTTECTARGNNTVNDTGNIYNHIEPVSDDTYNHINTLNIRGDDTYNVTGDFANGTAYNTAETLSRSKIGAGIAHISARQQSEVDDTYNHIDRAVSKLELQHDTDDTYNTPDCDMRDAKHVANAYAYSTTSAKTPVVSPDKGNMKYDYAFAEPGFTGGSTMPIRFKLDEPAAVGNYAFATEPSASADYQLAKPPGH